MDLRLFELKLFELKRRGDTNKVKVLQGLRKKIMPSQLEKIQEGDKHVLEELFLPKWLSWELLQSWASQYRIEEEGRKCVLCEEKSELGVDFKDKFICENCFVRLKNLE